MTVCSIVFPMLEFSRTNSEEDSVGGYDKLFALLGADSDEAGRNYQLLRTKLISYFECRKATPAEDYADEVLHRIAEKIEAGETIEDVNRYAFGVARFVRLESYRKQTDLPIDTAGARAGSVGEGRVHPSLTVEPKTEILDNDSIDNVRRECLRSCLMQLNVDHRDLLLAYYHTDESSRKHKDHRRRLAEKYKKSAGALQKQMCLLRQKVSRCTKVCMAGGAP